MNSLVHKVNFLKFTSSIGKEVIAPNLAPFVFDLDPLTSLTYVDDKESLHKFESSLNKSSIIGIDTETKPIYSKGVNPTALIQIAIRSSACPVQEEVFIIDLLRLNQNKSSLLLFDEIFKQPLHENNIIKLGQDLRSDFILLSRSYPNLDSFQYVSNIIEINSLVSILESKKKQISLKEQVKIYLNNDLIKKQQCSNWSIRPLSLAQLHYAACDALVLLRLFDVLCHRIENKKNKENNSFNTTDVTNMLDHVTTTNIESIASLESKNIETPIYPVKDLINNRLSSDMLLLLNTIQESFNKKKLLK